MLWISITDRLPKNGEIVEIKGHSIADEIPIITSGMLITKEGCKIQKQFTVTHWRSLKDIYLVCGICGAKVQRVGSHLVHCFSDRENHYPTTFKAVEGIQQC